jgi:YD repeat-containing protein
MNLSKITMPVVSFISLISLSTCAVAGTTDIVKKHFLQQLKMLSQAQSGKSLKKASAKAVLLTDSVETYIWGDPSWEKDGDSRYSYDQNGRVIQVTTTGWNETKTVYQYDADGKTVRELSISSSDIKADGVDTTFTVTKFFSAYSNAILALYNGSSAEFDITNLAVFAGLDSLTTVIYTHTGEGTNDTSLTATIKYEKAGNTIIR